MHVALMFLQPDLRPSSCRDASQRALIVILAHLRLKVNVAQSRPTLCVKRLTDYDHVAVEGLIRG